MYLSKLQTFYHANVEEEKQPKIVLNITKAGQCSEANEAAKPIEKDVKRWHDASFINSWMQTLPRSSQPLSKCLRARSVHLISQNIARIVTN